MELILHPLTKRQLAALGPGSGSILFVGPTGLGRTATAHGLAARLNCQGSGNDDCHSCHLIKAGNFPDLITIKSESASIGVEQVKALQEQLIVQPYYQSSQRVVIIEPAETLTLEAQNRLLKTLEEPPPRTLIILITTTAEALTATIRSRAQAVRFVAPSPRLIKQFLAQSGYNSAQIAQVERLRLNRPALIGRLLADLEALGAYTQLSQLADGLLGDGVYDRLRLVPQILTLNLGALELTTVLRARIAAVRPAAAQLIASLEALGRYHQRLGAGVTAKAALEGLALEL